MKPNFKFVRILGAFGALALAFLVINLFLIDHSFSKKGKKPSEPPRSTAEAIVEGNITSLGGVPYCQYFDTDKNMVMTFPDIMDLSYFQGETFKQLINGEPDGASCFSEGIYSNMLMSIMMGADGTMEAATNFYSSMNDSPSDLHYNLTLFGEPLPGKPNNIIDGSWPPEPGDTTTIYLNNWEFFTWGKGKAKKVSCTGSGYFPEDGGVLLTVVRSPVSDCTNNP